MTNNFCLTQNTSSEIYKLAKRSEETIATKQVTLMVASGSSLKVLPTENSNHAPWIVEAKLISTGWYNIKFLLENGDRILLDTHNFNKTDFPVRNFTDQFVLEKVDGRRDLIRVFNVPNMELYTSRQSFINPVERLATFCAKSNRSFLENLIGADNLVTDYNSPTKLKITIRKNKVTKGSLFNSNLYLYKDIGDCESIKVKDIESFDEDQIIIKHHYASNAVSIYLDETKHNVLDILTKLETCGQKDFYIKRNFKEPVGDIWGYVEPVIIVK